MCLATSVKDIDAEIGECLVLNYRFKLLLNSHCVLIMVKCIFISIYYWMVYCKMNSQKLCGKWCTNLRVHLRHVDEFLLRRRVRNCGHVCNVKNDVIHDVLICIVFYVNTYASANRTFVFCRF